MTSTQAAPRARIRRRTDPWLVLRFVAVVMGLAFVVFGIPALMHGPGFVDHLTVVNPTGMAVEVSVARTGSDERLPIGSVPARSRTTFLDVVDMGGSWSMQVVANGAAHGDTTVSRAALSGHNWTFTVPDQLQSELSRGGGITEPRN